MTISTDPLHLAVSKSKGIKIDWSDGHKSDYSCELLRDECPCATCTGAHGTEPQRTDYSKPAPAADPFQMYKPKIRMNNIEEVGTYAVRIDWNDGHNAGIYSYEHLRRICPCAECMKLRQEGRL
ncbi:gamma-butyrobetaine hydroxylase-like domain-containing protein [Paludibaculum fermentans]|uniref:gamma-butyrobetaine hydroxylase-like domain-containing protein n=1 Tax=Paludibaculum fermentans TaxID=1473598 RepID=UPI003EBEF334